ncbi:MAG: radical SAM protein [Eubacterium sp.]|nr:radical SAM protein [Eubacterium sp.]
MRQTNISVFVTHSGCPHICSFCNQRTISGQTAPITAEELEKLLTEQQPILEQSETQAQIAFFGGSFTAIDRGYMLSLLECGHSFIKRYPKQYTSLRCSTRPDYIDTEILDILGRYGMRSIELGAQSMNDEILSANQRGHTAEDVRNASRLIKGSGFELGLQMMTGLYKDKPEYCIDTAREFISLGCDTVRIYPTVILKDTELDRLRAAGEYDSFTFDETVKLCTELLGMFDKAGIPVIRLGLHASDDVKDSMTGGVYHPALREICESGLFLEKMRGQMMPGGKYIVYTDKRNISRVTGHGGCNKKALAEQGITFVIKEEAGTEVRAERV